MPIDTFDLEIYGLDEMEKKMDAFGPEFTRKCVTQGVEAASNLLKEVMKGRAPVSTEYSAQPGELRDSIDILLKAQNVDRPNVVAAAISPIYEKSEGEQSPGYYCRFVEYGSVHNPHPDAFMRGTIDEAGMKAIDLCITVTGQALDSMSGSQATTVPGSET
jgi:HK97 gp10 family phage protein